MKSSRRQYKFWWQTVIASLALPVLAASYSASAMGDDNASSGFIAPAIESKMQKIKLSDDRVATRWISTDLTKVNYSAVMVDRVIFYPAPNPGPQVSSSALENIADYLTEALRRELGDVVQVVDTGGPGVLRMQPAITAVIVKKEGLSVKDVLPAHLVFSAASAVSGHMDEDVTAMVEVRITDSVSREYRAAIRTSLEGKQLENQQDTLTVKDMKQSLDEGAKAGARAIREALQGS